MGELFVSYITCVKLLNDDDDDYLIIISGDHNFLGTTLPSPCIFASSEIFLVNAFWQCNCGIKWEICSLTQIS